jgi:hypothetical protein
MVCRDLQLFRYPNVSIRDPCFGTIAARKHLFGADIAPAIPDEFGGISSEKVATS